MHTHADDSTLPAGHRFAVAGAAALVEAVHLAWEWTHGGIVSHHLLNDPARPAIWNGWGLLLLPLIAWTAAPRLLRRSGRSWRPHPPAMLRLVSGVVAGLALAIAFSLGRMDAVGTMFLVVALSGLVARVYRIEYLLGFVLGMAFTFGAILPTVVGGVIALLSDAVWFGPWRLVRRAMSRSRA